MNDKKLIEIMENSANCRVPIYYMSGLQWSRMFALVYLDDNLRNDKQFGHIYKQSVKEFLEEKQSFARSLKTPKDDGMEKECGPVGEAWDLFFQNMFDDDIAYENFKNEIPNIELFLDRFYCFLDYAKPEQSFLFALEENPYWGAVNGLFYLLAIHHFYQVHNPLGLTHNVYQVVNGNKKLRVDLLLVIIKNMMFLKTVKIDPPPDVMNGYGISTLESMANGHVQGLTLPANATCC